MMITASQLRSNIYRILDRVLETGESVSVTRHGKIIKIISPAVPSKLSRLKKMGKICDDPESIVHMDWSSEWKGNL